MTVGNAKSAEHEVERNRDDLERTLSALRTNLKPSHLAREALSGGGWFARFQAFATSSPVAWAIMTGAAVSLGVRASRRIRR